MRPFLPRLALALALLAGILGGGQWAIDRADAGLIGSKRVLLASKQAGLPTWLPLASGIAPTLFSDFTTEGTSNHYWYLGKIFSSFAAWNTAIGGTYGRSSAATYLQSGVVKTASSGVPRFPSDINGVPTGLRLTGAGTNLCLWSQDFTNAAWSANGFTVTGNFATAPDGTATANRVQIGAGSQGSNFLQQSISSLTTAQTNTASVWVRVASGTAKFAIKLSQGGIGNHYSSDLTATTTWQRFSFSQAFSAGGSAGFPGLVSDAAGDAVDLIAWGYRVDGNSSFATDYIPTTTGTVTQAADSWTLAAASPGGAVLAGTSGTLIVKTNAILNGGSGLAAQFVETNVAGGGAAYLYRAMGSDAAVSSFSGTSLIAATLGSGTFAGGDVTSGITWSPSGRAIVGNGGTVNSDSNAISNTTPTTFTIGGSGGSPMYGQIKKIIAWPMNVSNAQLQALTQ